MAEPQFDPSKPFTVAPAFNPAQAFTAEADAPESAMRARQSGFGASDRTDEPAPSGIAQWFNEKLRPMLEQVAHPQTISDIAALLVPDQGLTAAARGGVAVGESVAAKAAAAKALLSRVRVDPRVVADEFSLVKPLKVTKAVSLAPATPEMTAPGFDRYLPNQSGYVRDAVGPPSTAVPATVSTTLPTAAKTVDEFTAARSAKATAARQPGAGTLPDQKALNDAALAERRAAYQASQKGAPEPLPPAGPVVKESGKMQLTAPEMKEFSRLLKRGLSLEESLTAVKSARSLAAQLGGATDAQVAAAVAHRGATGSW